jgi:hypothetical protein
VLSGSRAREESERGEQVTYEEIYVRSNTGISDIEDEIDTETAQRSRV